MDLHCAQVWKLYAEAAKLLLVADPCVDNVKSRVLCTTLMENASMLHGLLGVSQRKWRPSIPQLVYQYSLYTNYDSPPLDTLNPEIDS